MPTLPGGRTLLVAGLLVLLGALGPGAARAQCIAPDPAEPMIIACANDSDGFASPLSGFSISVQEGATVSNDLRDTIDLDNDSRVVEVFIDATASASNGLAGGAVVSVGDDATVQNRGTITVTGVGGFGIRGGSNDSVLTEVGSTIDLQAGGSTGIAVQDGAINGLAELIHNGAITGDQSASQGIRVVSENEVILGESSSITLTGDDSTGVELADDGNVLTSDGMIEVTGTNGVGLRVLGGDNVINLAGTITVGPGGGAAVSFENASGSNTLTVDSTGSSTGFIEGNDSGIAVRGGAGNDSLVSDGRIVGDVDLGAGDDVVDLGVFGGSLRGNVMLGGDADSFGLSGGTLEGDVDGGDGDDVFAVAGGILTGNVTLGAGADQFFFSDGTLEGNLDLGGGADTLTLSEDAFFNDSLVNGGAEADALILQNGFSSQGQLDLAALSNFESLEVTGGDWLVVNDSSFSDGVRVSNGALRVASPVTLTGDLTVEGDADPMVQQFGFLFVEADATLTVDGDYVQQGESSLVFSIRDDNDSGIIDVTGTAEFRDGAVLFIAQEEPLTQDQLYTVLSADGGITNDSIVSEPAGTAVLTFDLEVQPDVVGDRLVLIVDRTGYAQAASTANQVSVGTAFDGVLADDPADDDLNELLTALDRVTADAFGGALDSLGMEAYDAQTSSAIAFGQAFARMAVRNLVECESAFYAAVPDWIADGPSCEEDHWIPWFDTFGGFRERDGGGDNIDYTAQDFGLAMGVGRTLGRGWNVSGHIGGGFGNLDVDGVGDGSLQILDLGLAAARRSGGLSTRAAVDYGLGFHEQDRRVALPGYTRNPTGEYQSHRVTGLLEATYDFQDEDTLSLAPVGSLEVTWLSEESFTETGGQAANLSVDERSQLATSTSLGVRFAASLVKHRYVLERIAWANGLWRPEVDVRWRGNWTDVDRDLKGRVAAAPLGTGTFLVQGEDAGQGIQVDVGTTFQPYGTQALLSLGYRGFIGLDTEVQFHRFGLDIRIPF